MGKGYKRTRKNSERKKIVEALRGGLMLRNGQKAFYTVRSRLTEIVGISELVKFGFSSNP